ncbi:hypothetical protein FNV43_RR01620 [Rhamnella rubrinervis]|uniref:Uncharacterized protein n=1 Tax=Rhamnella rubrinervis TaxID=2594499 RepID=A0A8K0MT14_9ROSA|nr:hypothetical protein FNV43_RR01620 [Rhamnella rubrinervis]
MRTRGRLSWPSTPKDSFIASFARLPRLLWPFTPAAGLTLHRIAKECYLVDPARVICLSQRLSHACDFVLFSGLRIGVMINSGPGHSDFIVEVKFWIYERRNNRKAFAKDVFINQERKWGSRRIDTALVSTINDATVDRADVAYRTHAPYEKSKSWVPGSMVARLKLKGIDGRAPLEWSLGLI